MWLLTVNQLRERFTCERFLFYDFLLATTLVESNIFVSSLFSFRNNCKIIAKSNSYENCFFNAMNIHS